MRMKRRNAIPLIPILCLLLSVLVASSCHRRGAIGPEIRVATWNTCWFPSGRPNPQLADVEYERIAVAAREIRRAEPDIVCLQEIRDLTTVETLCRLTEIPDLRVAACSEFPGPENVAGSQQNVILTRLPVIEAGFKRWTSAGFVDPPRGYTYALLQSPKGIIAVFCVHLKSNYIPKGADIEQQTTLNRLKRELASEQVRAKAKELMGRSPTPIRRVIIAGDFNTSLYDSRWSEEDTLRAFLREGYAMCFADIPSTKIHTLAATPIYPPVTFDYIWHIGFSAQRRPRVHPFRHISDHAMVSLSLEMR